MSADYWLRQQADDPLFPDVVWSRPQSRVTAGKLTIIGGNSHGFGAPGMAYNTALESGIGVCRVVLPDAIKKIVKGLLPDADFAPSTPSGSFSQLALDTLLSNALWGDAVLLCGDIGRNSETAILLEKFVAHYTNPLCITQDAVDYFKETPLQLVDRPKTLIALSLSQLQKMFIATPSITPIMLSMTTQQLVEALHEYTQNHPACIITMHNGLVFVAQNGQVATQHDERKIWRVVTSARASVFWLQNPDSQFESATTSLIVSGHDDEKTKE